VTVRDQRLQCPKNRMHAVDDGRTGLRPPRRERLDMERVDIAGKLGKPSLVARREDSSTYESAHRRNAFEPVPRRARRNPEDCQSGASHRAVMQLDEVYEKLTEILRDQFDDDTLTARPDLTADDVDGWDSFAHIRLMLTVEQSFQVKFSASQISALKNVGELATLIASKAA
jgi:acyl carrier protein